MRYFFVQKRVLIYLPIYVKIDLMTTLEMSTKIKGKKV